MTEIRIERRPKIWPWLLLALGLLAVVLYFLWSGSDGKNDETDESTSLLNVHENNKTVADYVAFVKSDTSSMTLDHKYTNRAILKLTDAIAAMSEEIDFDLKADLDKVKEHANLITDDPFETTHADHIRIAADMLAHSLQRMQQAKYPGLQPQAEELKNRVAAIDPKTLTLDQKIAVKGFFTQAADLLEGMN